MLQIVGNKSWIKVLVWFLFYFFWVVSKWACSFWEILRNPYFDNLKMIVLKTWFQKIMHALFIDSVKRVFSTSIRATTTYLVAFESWVRVERNNVTYSHTTGRPLAFWVQKVEISVATSGVRHRFGETLVRTKSFNATHVSRHFPRTDDLIVFVSPTSCSYVS